MIIRLKYIYLLCFVFLFIACGENTDSKPIPSETPKSDTESETKPSEAKAVTKNIIFFGNSLSAAYRVDPALGFAGLIATRIDSLDLNYKVINAGSSGDSSAGGVGRIDWVLKQKTDIFILELGGNDGLRGQDTQAVYDNLQTILDRVKTKYPEVKIVIAGMEAPPNMGKAYTDSFRAIYQKLAKVNNAALIPFLLDGVGGIPELNLSDGIHPNVEGHKIVAENVWKVLQPIL